MIQKYSRYRVLEVFFREPRRKFHQREISRMIKLAQPSVRNHLEALLQEEFIKKSDKGLYGGYIANRDNEHFKRLQQQHTVHTLHHSGCVQALADKLMPQSIVLFGSAARGEDIEESDIDLFIECKEEEIDLKKYEKQLNRKIHLVFKKDFKKLSKEFKNNIINGVKLKGFVRAY
jgi:predicted nucleotidyltransferase